MAKKNKKRDLTEEEVEKAYQEIKVMVQTMEDIYFKNLNFFEDNYKKIYKLVQKEASKIEKNKSKEKYSVELNSTGSLDIINREDNSFMYNKKDPFMLGDKIAKKLDAKSIAFEGVGLATHISAMIKQYKPKKVLVCEKNIQYFRCSMYVTDYEELAGLTKLSFSIDKKCDSSDYKKVYKLEI